MHVPVKMITGIWQNDKDSSPLQYQFVADPLKPWRITALNELHTSIVNLHPAKVHCEGYMASPPGYPGLWHVGTGCRTLLPRQTHSEPRRG